MTTAHARRPKIKQTKHLTLRDRLSRLTYVRACQLLGPQGAQLIREGSNYEIDIQRDVYLRGDLFRVKFPHAVRRQGCRGHDHHHGRRPQPPEVQLHGLRNDLPARRGRRVAGAGREDRAGPGRAARREPAAGTAQRERAHRTRPRASGRSGPSARSSASRRPTTASPGPTTRWPAPCRARPIAWPCGAKSGGNRTARAPTSAPTRSARASTSCTCWTACGGAFPRPCGGSLIAIARPSSTCSTAKK